MVFNIIELVIVLIGLAVIPLLFYHIPRLPEVRDMDEHIPTMSIIIPARNEDKNLPLLLKDLSSQSVKPLEIICVDDESSDNTAQIAESYGVKVISLHNKPEGWTGKTWACQNGANVAKGELLLFFDADVRLEQNGIKRLIQAYSDNGCTISVQPYHKTERWYEQFSLLFNLIQIAANGTSMPKPVGVGLYGPIILISKNNYIKIDGHESVRKSVVEDMALGQRHKQAGIPYRLFVGDKGISFRMYGDGLRCLFQGWVKNIASGASRTSPSLLLMVFFWIASIISVPLHVIVFIITGSWPWLVLYSILYIIWVAVLLILSKRVGHFHCLSVFLYPVLLIVLISVFTISTFKKIFGLKVTWKGRAIEGEDKK